MRSQTGRARLLRPVVRLGLASALAVGFGFAIPHLALGAQGGEEDGLAGAGQGAFGTTNPDNPANETAAFGNGEGGSDDAGGAGGGGGGGGLGGAEGEGGGAGGGGRGGVGAPPPLRVRNCLPLN